jgi:hypothetical protein
MIKVSIKSELKWDNKSSKELQEVNRKEEKATKIYQNKELLTDFHQTQMEFL